MTYRLTLSPHAVRAYQKLDPSRKSRIQAALDSLLDQPLAGPQVKRLKGRLHEYCRYRVGDYRVIYSVAKEERVIYVDYVQHRKDVYRSIG